ncbi:MAG: restriction endonuclease subunit S [Tomitella sp.]|nr:restriction endonuclease subunit S [Tomitella sp.]
MSESWPTIPLGQIVRSGELSYGIVQPGREEPGGVPIVRVKDLAQGRISTRAPLRVLPSISEQHSRTVLRGGELLVSIVGTVGESAIVPEGLAGWNVARAIAVVRPLGVSATWVRLALGTREVRATLESVLNTTVQATLNLADLKRLRIPMPPEATRNAISEVLGALDDKIAANDNLRTLTDSLCRARFQRASASHNVEKLSSIAVVNVATVRPRVDGMLRYVDISSVGQGSFDFPEESKWNEAPGRARRVLRAGDTIWSTVRPNRRSHALVLDEDSSLIASTGLAVLTPLDGRIAGLYESCRTDQFVGYLESVAEGSAYPAVRADRFNNAPVPALRAEEWAEFERFALPLRQRAHAAAVESRNLAATRDELLPLLMSGKIRVRDAERQVEDVL